MKKFAFRLEKVLNYRHKICDIAREDLVKTKSAVDLSKKTRDEKEEEVVFAKKNKSEFQHRKKFDVELLRLQNVFISAKEMDLKDAEKILQEKEKIFEAAAKVYLNKKNEATVLDKLKEKRKKEYDIVFTKDMQNLMDESFNSSLIRKGVSDE